jgi:hypothetical protein
MWGSGGIAPSFWVSGQATGGSFKHRPLYPRYSLARRLGWRYSWNGLDTVSQRTISYPCRESNPAAQPVVRRYTGIVLQKTSTVSIFRVEDISKQHASSVSCAWKTWLEDMTIVARFRGVTIDGVWIGEWIYGPFIHATRNYK